MGEIINNLRLLVGVSLLDLSEKTGVSMYDLSLILSGRKNATKDELGSIFIFFANEVHAK